MKPLRFPSLNDFRTARADYVRRGIVAAVVGGALFLCVMLLAILSQAPWFPVMWEPARPLLALAMLPLAIGMLITAIFWTESLRKRYWALSCPYCDKPLVVHQVHHYLIATGNCPHCGRRVIKDELHGK